MNAFFRPLQWKQLISVGRVTCSHWGFKTEIVYIRVSNSNATTDSTIQNEHYAQSTGVEFV